MVEMDTTDPAMATLPNIPEETSEWVWSMTWSWTNLLQLIFSLVGSIGNLLVILVLAGRQTARYSMDVFILALAVADFLTSVVMIPVPMAQRVPDTIAGSLYCKVIYPSYLLWIFAFSSAYILAGMSVERFVAVAYPLHRHHVITKRRVYIFLAVVGVLSIPGSAQNLKVEVIGNRCQDTKPMNVKIDIAIYLFFSRVGFPVLTMVVTQVLTALVLHRQHKELENVLSAQKGGVPSIHLTARNNIVKMTATVVAVFILSLGPSNLMFMITGLRGTIRSHLFSPLYYVLNVFAFINPTANPFIYAARYPKFRTAIKDVFTKGLSKTKLPLFDQGIDHYLGVGTQITNASAVSGLI
ncbi:allatostatin-A receptor-like [Diadema antillarum]|uniref:allatostatin-A receptor-like n=1 Tax=Diadema antillarum TaxID=105358 RepID=UPI003A8A6CD7